MSIIAAFDETGEQLFSLLVTNQLSVLPTVDVASDVAVDTAAVDTAAVDAAAVDVAAAADDITVCCCC